MSLAKRKCAISPFIQAMKERFICKNKYMLPNKSEVVVSQKQKVRCLTFFTGDIFSTSTGFTSALSSFTTLIFSEIHNDARKL